MSKQIAIFGWKIGENSYGITVPYYDYFNRFGEVSILSPVKDINFDKYDLLVIPGGPDINPATYNYIPSMATGRLDPIREYFDTYILPQAIEQEIPIVGICRGHQAVGIYYKGVLHQDMSHGTNPANDRGKLVHGLDIFTRVLPEELQQALLEQAGNPKKSTLTRRKEGTQDHTRLYQDVNSMHHQSLMDVPDGASLLATHYDKDDLEDKTIEALYYPNNIITFQYHPEEIWDVLSSVCVRYLTTIKEKARNNEKILRVPEIHE